MQDNASHQTGINMQTKSLLEGLPVSDAKAPQALHDLLFQHATDLGFVHVHLMLSPDHDQIADAGRFALRLTTFPESMLNWYSDRDISGHDPLLAHCREHSTSIIWSESDFNGSAVAAAYYARLVDFNARAGITLPFHGPKAEFGVLTFAGDLELSGLRDLVPELSSFRDFIMEGLIPQLNSDNALVRGGIEITSRELECLQWCASGKSSWDIAQIMNCTEATVNFHFTNIRRKFGASSRRMAVVQAIRLGFINV